MSSISDESWTRRWRHCLQLALGPPLVALLIRLLRRTWRLRRSGREPMEQCAANDQRFVMIFWHAHILASFYAYCGPQLVFLVSQHRDGEMIARVMQRFGYVAARGSTTSGGSAGLRELLRAVRAGHDIGLTPDGPRGPARVVQPGVVAAARHLQIPIIPVATGASRAWRMNSWDRFLIPKPFARVLLAFGEPITIAADEPLEQATLRVQTALRALEAAAEQAV